MNLKLTQNALNEINADPRAEEYVERMLGFENTIVDVNPVIPMADGWGEKRNSCEPFPYGLLSIQQWSASCDKITVGWVSYSEEYEQIRMQFLEGPFSETETNGMLDTWMEQIRAATIEAAELHDDALTISDWERAMDELKTQLSYARSN